MCRQNTVLYHAVWQRCQKVWTLSFLFVTKITRPSFPNLLVSCRLVKNSQIASCWFSFLKCIHMWHMTCFHFCFYIQLALLYAHLYSQAPSGQNYKPWSILILSKNCVMLRNSIIIHLSSISSNHILIFLITHPTKRFQENCVSHTWLFCNSVA